MGRRCSKYAVWWGKLVLAELENTKACRSNVSIRILSTRMPAFVDFPFKRHDCRKTSYFNVSQLRECRSNASAWMLDESRRQTHSSEMI